MCTVTKLTTDYITLARERVLPCYKGGVIERGETPYKEVMTQCLSTEIGYQDHKSVLLSNEKVPEELAAKIVK